VDALGAIPRRLLSPSGLLWVLGLGVFVDAMLRYPFFPRSPRQGMEILVGLMLLYLASQVGQLEEDSDSDPHDRDKP
jgi:hypothetical protein